MEVTYNALKDINMEELYLTKTCDCGSILNITYKDILNIIPDVENKIYIHCPCCGAKIELYKYFKGRKYSLNQYAECVDNFKEEVFNLINSLLDINRGYGEYYFNLSDVKIIPCPAKIYFNTYIDQYEEDNWNKKIEEHKIFVNNLTIDISKKIACNSIYEYAQYTQALIDYIVEKISYYKSQLFSELKSIKFEVINDALIKIFRDPNIDISELDFSPIEHRIVMKKNAREAKTIFTPDIKDGLTYVGNKIEIGSENIADSIYSIASVIHNNSIREVECQRRLDVSIHGYIN